MNDASFIAANGAALPFAGHPTTLATLLRRTSNGFSVLAQKPGSNGKSFQQRFIKSHQLHEFLPAVDAPGDHYIAVNEFRYPVRRIKALHTLAASFLDLDYYNVSHWENADPAIVQQEIFNTLLGQGIPMPQAVVFSGRGLQLFWVYEKSVPREALPRWRAVQEYLAKSLKAFGPDYCAMDAARVLRIPGTINSKSGKRAYFIYLDMDGVTDFEVLASSVLPFNRFELRERRNRKKQGNNISIKANNAGKAARTYNTDMLQDIRRLIEFRWANCIPENFRNKTLFVYGCFLVRQTGIVALPDALMAFGRKVCNLDEDELEMIAGSITNKIHDDGRGYKFSTVGAARWLNLTIKEAKAAKLKRLFPADPEHEAQRKKERAARDRQRKATRRLDAGARSQRNSLMRLKPWLKLKMSRATWYRKGKPDGPKDNQP